MKKVISIIIGLLCVCATYAISYASPYKGSVSRHSAHIVHSGMASMPTASMGSVSAGMMSSGSSSNNQSSLGINYATSGGLSGIATCATTIRGGVTTRQTAASMNASMPNNAPRHAKKEEGVDPHGNPEGLPDCGCYWYYDKDEGVWKCTNCPCVIDLYDGPVDHCDCNPCQCPIEWDWSVLAFLSLLSFAYIAYKKRQKMSNFVKTVF